LDPGYYLQHFTEYSVWSFEVHTQQVAQVLRVLPKESVLVVPGDGIGIVSRQWPEKQVKSGDFSRDAFTHKIVSVESFTQTMDRGASGDVLLLSYVYSLFTPEEQVRVAQWDGPVVIIDNRDQSPGPQYSHVGPGVFVVGVEGFVRENMDYVPTSAQLFSENLLSLEKISFITRNPSVSYWETMRPLVFARRFPSEGPLIVHSLPELARYQEQGEDVVGCYLTSIGGYFHSTVPICVDICTQFERCRVYEVGSAHPAVSTLKKYSHWAVYGSSFYFCFLRNCQLLRQMTAWRISPLGEVKQAPYAARLLAYNQGKVYVAVLTGTVSFPLYREDVRYGFLLYLEKYGHPSWKDVYASGSVVSQVGSAFVQVGLPLRQDYNSRLNPRRFPWNVGDQIDFEERRDN